MLTLFSFIFVIGILVFIHELGHFLAAKSVGVRVEKFYLGFNFFGLGWKKIYNETEYGIGLFPFGGYVKVAGVIDESMDENFTGAPDEFRSKNTIEKIWIMSAGVIMNFILAILIFSHLTYYNGIYEPDPKPIIGETIKDYPAQELGIQANDLITTINSISIHNWDEMALIIKNNPNKLIEISWERNNEIFTDSILTKSMPQLKGDKMIQEGLIGIIPILDHKDVSLLNSIVIGFKKTNEFLNLTFRSLIALLKGNVSMKEMAGPIMIAKIAGETAASGFNDLLGLMAFLSINLGLINILPVPGLDGGHVLIAMIEGIIRKELPLKIKLGVQQFGMLILLILFFTIMINDIQRLFN